MVLNLPVPDVEVPYEFIKMDSGMGFDGLYDHFTRFCHFLVRIGVP